MPAMRYLVPILLLTLACSSGPPATYAKGTYRPAPTRAPTFSPAEDAPHTFRPGRASPTQPGPRPEALPHTPQTRREDTIWASDAPSDAPAVTFNWDVPVPKDDEEVADQIRRCADTMKGASTAAGMLRQYDVDRMDRLNVNWRLCWPHMAVLQCIDKELDRRSSQHPRNVAATAETRATLLRARAVANESVAEHCSGVPWYPDMALMMRRALTAAGYGT